MRYKLIHVPIHVGGRLDLICSKSIKNKSDHMFFKIPHTSLIKRIGDAGTFYWRVFPLKDITKYEHAFIEQVQIEI